MPSLLPHDLLPWAEFLTLAPSSDRIPVELFQILKDDAVESAALNMQYAICTQYAGSWHGALPYLLVLPKLRNKCLLFEALSLQCF